MIFHGKDQRLKWVFSSCKNGAWGAEPDGENDAVCIRAADFDGQLGRLNDGERTLRSIDRETFDKISLRRGDIIIEKSGGGEKQLVGRSVIFDGDEPSVTSNFLARCRPAEGIEPAFVNYLLLSLYNGRATYAHLKQSTGIQNLDLASFLNIKVRVPSPEAQRRIVRFLDEKTTRIDALIEKKRLLLERLAKERQALITQAVTKGLNPLAPLKPSGVSWLGEVPAHWEVLPVKRVAKLESGHTPDKKIDAYWENCDIPWVSLNDTAVLRSADYISETTFNINALGLANSSARLLPPRAVVFTRDATIGESAITTRSMAVSQHIIAWLCNEEKIIPEFLLLVIYGMTAELLRLTNGSTIGTIGLSDVKSIVVALPPLTEQSEIVSSTFDGKGKIAFVFKQIEASISRLIEYRAALITAAVTEKMHLEAMPKELALGEV